MTKCHTRQIVEVRYSRAVNHSVRQLRVLPIAQRGSQKVLQESWSCEPTPTATRENLDAFGNRVIQIYHQKTRFFRFEMSLVSQRDSTICARETNLPPTGTGAFLLPTKLCDTNVAVLNCADQLRKIDIINSDALQTSRRVCEWLGANIEYSSGETTLQTGASEVLGNRRGVCQDFAHAMIALCRSARVPARYVSGFNVGEGAMHAWVETLCDGAWHAFDPTHGCATSESCVVVAVGRDFRDVSPLRGRFTRGRFIGNANVELRNWCETRVLDEAKM